VRYMKVAIWGTGAYCKDLMEYLVKINSWLLVEGLSTVDCQFFIDNENHKKDKIFAEKPVINPKTININDVDIVIIAVAKYPEILRQIENERSLMAKIVIYNIKYKLRFLWDLYRIRPDIGFRQIVFLNRKLEIMDAVAMYQDSSQDIIKKLSCVYSKENIMAAVEELNNVNCNETLYDSLRNTSIKASGRRCIGIYYPRFYNGGVERVISQLMPIFIDLGFKIVLISEEISTVKEYQCPVDVIRVALPKREVDRFEWYEKLGTVIKKYGVGIMHFHDFHAYSIESLVIYYLRIMGVASVVHVHQYHKAIKDNELLVKTYKWANKVIVLSKEDEQFWIGKCVPAKYIPNPINFHIDYIYHKKQPEKPVVLWMGRIDQRQKQVYDVVDIMRELVKMIPNACLRIIGSADSKEIMEELHHRIKIAGLEKSIMFMGYLLEPWVECGDADVMLMTSAYEGFPMALMECKMAGIPLVMYSLPYLELVKDGKGYIGVEQNDVVGAAKMLARVIEDKDLQDEMSQEARASIELFFECDIKKKWGDIFTSLI